MQEQGNKITTNKIEVVNRSLGVNSSSFWLGIPLMVIGVMAVLGGIGSGSFYAIGTGLAVLIFTAFLLLSIDCIAIDKENNQIRLYKDYFITSFGQWIPLNNYTSVSLYYQIDKPGYHPTTHNEYQYKTFEVHLTSDNNNLLIKDYGELEPARKLQLLISQKTGLHYNDKAIREF